MIQEIAGQCTLDNFKKCEEKKPGGKVAFKCAVSGIIIFIQLEVTFIHRGKCSDDQASDMAFDALSREVDKGWLGGEEKGGRQL